MPKTLRENAFHPAGLFFQRWRVFSPKARKSSNLERMSGWGRRFATFSKPIRVCQPAQLATAGGDDLRKLDTRHRTGRNGESSAAEHFRQTAADIGLMAHADHGLSCLRGEPRQQQIAPHAGREDVGFFAADVRAQFVTEQASGLGRPFERTVQNEFGRPRAIFEPSAQLRNLSASGLGQHAIVIRSSGLGVHRVAVSCQPDVHEIKGCELRVEGPTTE